MDNTVKKIGLSGSCYWCTEAIFLSLRGKYRSAVYAMEPYQNTEITEITRKSWTFNA